MTTTSPASPKSEPFWRRWSRRIGEFGAAMEMTYDELQDRRMERIEEEIARLRTQIDAPPPPESIGLEDEDVVYAPEN